jgi:hypothetical protein
MRLQPDQPAARVVFDPRGIHHRTIPARNLIEAVGNHAEQKNLSVAESLSIVKKLKTLDLVTGTTSLRAQGAVVQAFHGAAGYEASHTMPCQLVIGNQFPHALKRNGQLLNLNYLQRTLTLFGRCTWQRKLVNAIDLGLEWMPQDGRQHGFVSTFLDAVGAVLQGAQPSDAYRDYAKRRVAKLGELLEQARDEPFTVYDATLMLSGIYGEGLSGADVTRLQVDKEATSMLQEERVLVIESIREKDRVVPHAVVTGQLDNSIDGEEW